MIPATFLRIFVDVLRPLDSSKPFASPTDVPAIKIRTQWPKAYIKSKSAPYTILDPWAAMYVNNTMRIGAAQGVETTPKRSPSKNAPISPFCFTFILWDTGMLNLSISNRWSPITRQTAPTIHFQNLPTSPKSPPTVAAMIPSTAKVIDNPKTKTAVKRKERFNPDVFSMPPTKPIMRGIIARTQGLEAVRIPPTNTVTNANHGLV